MPLVRTAADAAAGDVKLEAITQPLYDNATIATGAGVNVFFQNPAGRSKLFTNLETAGQLTWPKRMSVKAFRLVPAPSVARVDDLASFYTNGHSYLRVGEKDYFVAPNFLLTPGVGLEAALVTGAAAPAAPAAGLVYGHNGRPEHKNIYVLQHSIWLPSTQNFRFVVEQAAASTLSASISTWVFLEGEYFREIQ